MKKITRAEIGWIISELDKAAAINLNAISAHPDIASSEKHLMNMKAANLTSVSSRLKDALNDQDKRIAIG